MKKEILKLSNELEALRIKDILDGVGIKFIIRSFHDSVYDGIFQNQYGWGVLEADEEDETRILELLKGKRDEENPNQNEEIQE
ncbi:MAG: hypothetical protein PHR81_02095 [Bacteroidales bacterium]|jgi:hypothetical protein|nr:hypothetical protein [Bacteroidales bacterium]MDD4213581.1 hypothetical protein [Bacteroidales bacterium]